MLQDAWLGNSDSVHHSIPRPIHDLREAVAMEAVEPVSEKSVIHRSIRIDSAQIEVNTCILFGG